MGRRACGHTCIWAYGHMCTWAYGHKDKSACRHIAMWTCGHVGIWALRIVVPLLYHSSTTSNTLILFILFSYHCKYSSWYMGTWAYGHVPVCAYGHVGIWPYGHMGMRSYRYIAIWSCGHMVMWTYSLAALAGLAGHYKYKPRPISIVIISL